jgi:hypothetical protein
MNASPDEQIVRQVDRSFANGVLFFDSIRLAVHLGEAIPCLFPFRNAGVPIGTMIAPQAGNGLPISLPILDFAVCSERVVAIAWRPSPCFPRLAPNSFSNAVFVGLISPTRIFVPCPSSRSRRTLRFPIAFADASGKIRSMKVRNQENTQLRSSPLA